METAIYVTKPFLPPIDEYVSYLEQVWQSSILTNNGPLHQRLERELCSYFNWHNISLVTNGHLSLEIALKSLNFEVGDEVITTPFTFVSTAAAIVNQGLIPVFCDISDNYTMDPLQIEQLITDKTAAILPVHVYGFPCEVEAIEEIAIKHKLKVIYDAAHAFGVRYKGKDIANYGDISMFSFHATKLFHTIEGGALVYSDSGIQKSIELNKNFGISGPESIELVGMNAKMNEMQAAMGLVMLRYLSDIIEKRKAIFERYKANLILKEGVMLPTINHDVEYNYAYMPALLEKNRDKVVKDLADNNIFVRKYFYPALSKVKCYEGFLRGNQLSNAETVSEQIITLPIYPSLTFEQVDDICSKLITIIRKRG